MSAPLALAIAGAAGRMGRALVAAARADAAFVIVGATEQPGSAAIGADPGGLAGGDPLGVTIVEDAAAAAATAEAWIDFTTPHATLTALAALPSRCAAIVGATGFDAAQEEALAQAALRRAIVRSGNFSLGLNVLLGLTRQAAAALGPDWDIEIHEAHHRHKVDAPSGTALMLGEAAAAGRGAPLSALRLAPHDGLAGPRQAGGIGFSSTRGGGIVGEHAVLLAAEAEYLRLEHVALNRALFAKGALAAARWARGRESGLFSMQDVLGF